MVAQGSAGASKTEDHYAEYLARARTFDRWFWLPLAVVAACGLGFVWLALPHAREDAKLWQFALKVGMFVFAVVAVALFPKLPRAGYLAASAPFLLFLGLITPKMTFYFLQGPQTLPEYYTYLWSLDYPVIMLSLCFAWRQAGGSSGGAIKIGLNGLILVFSGFLEWMWFRANPSMDYYGMKTIPHINVIIGHFPSYGGLFVYMLFHIPLLVAVNIAPFDRWIGKLRDHLAGRATGRTEIETHDSVRGDTGI